MQQNARNTKERRLYKTKCVQQIEKQNETKIESQSAPFRAHHKKINRNMKTKA